MLTIRTFLKNIFASENIFVGYVFFICLLLWFYCSKRFWGYLENKWSPLESNCTGKYLMFQFKFVPHIWNGFGFICSNQSFEQRWWWNVMCAWSHLIFVANATNGVSVKILKWEEFFPYLTRKEPLWNLVISHIMCDFTHNEYFFKFHTAN